MMHCHCTYKCTKLIVACKALIHCQHKRKTLSAKIAKAKSRDSRKVLYNILPLWVFPYKSIPQSSTLVLEEMLAVPYAEGFIWLWVTHLSEVFSESNWLTVPKENHLDTITASLKECPQAALPTIFTRYNLHII